MDLDDPSAAVAVDFREGREVLLIAFAGLAGKLGVPPFEFFQLTEGLPVNRIFLRDVRQCWYHRGLPGIGDDVASIAGFLRRYAGHPGTRHSVLLGNSGGGYAALLFGSLLRAAEVHAFAPKTFINPLRRLWLRDAAPRDRILGLLFDRRGQKELFDLRPVLSRSRTTTCHLHYAAHNRIDRMHAERLRALPGVVLHPYASGEHGLIRSLKEDGALRRIVLEALTASEAPGGELAPPGGPPRPSGRS